MTTTTTAQVLSDLPQRSVAEPMDAGILEQLQQHLHLETQASYHYWELSGRFASRELRGFASFLQNESDSEREHAGRFIDYLNDRGASFRLGSQTPFQGDASSVVAVFEAVFGMERDVTSSLQQIHRLAEEAGDTRTAVFLEPLIEDQITSEGNAAHLLGRLRIAAGNPAALLLIDQELGEGHDAPHRLAGDSDS
ncbi:ferritin [Synechococcus sp. RSCCF101]|uniref:ferritin n=1 Tax=Synechococcus sp. RSCCF101 TaxID=2511069 RepID=UPI001248FC25|nr:ferritin [Synechococcus sp. RSCCF101]QEY31503.1 ferritin [Synechococcus sp. RSCCF101]